MVRGTRGIANFESLYIWGPYGTVGGVAPADRNLVSGNDYGIILEGEGDLAIANLVGTGASGLHALGHEPDCHCRGQDPCAAAILPFSDAATAIGQFH